MKVWKRAFKAAVRLGSVFLAGLGLLSVRSSLSLTSLCATGVIGLLVAEHFLAHWIEDHGGNW